MRGARQSVAALRKADAIGAVVCLVLTGIVYLAAVRPWASPAEEPQDEGQAIPSQASLIAELSRTRASLEERIERARRISVRQRVELQPAGQANQRLAAIHELAGASGIEIDEVAIRDAVDRSGYQIIPIHITARGAFADAIGFLQAVHESFPDTAVTAFDLLGNPASAAAQTVMTFDLEWFVAGADGSS